MAMAMGRRGSRSGTGLGGRRWTEREGREALAAWKGSGLSASGFARQHGLNPQRLLWWRKQLGGWSTGEAIEPTASSTVSLIRAEVRESTTAAAGMAVRLPGGVVVEFADVNAVSPTWVASLASEVWRRS
jgi:transposase-like protein